MRALVIDDTKTGQLIICGILRGLGFDTDMVDSATEGLCRLETSEPYDVAFVDWNMPEMNGFQFVVAVRKKHQYDSMKIIMLTVESGLHYMARALESGADEYAIKPITETALRDKLAVVGLN